jgi:hypothetical protein
VMIASISASNAASASATTVFRLCHIQGLAQDLHLQRLLAQQPCSSRKPIKLSATLPDGTLRAPSVFAEVPHVGVYW